MPHSLASMQNLRQMPWWAVFGELVGAVQVFAGPRLVAKVGTGNLMAITVSAALIATPVIDHFRWFRMDVHAVTATKLVGAVLLVGGVVLITRDNLFQAVVETRAGLVQHE